MQHPIKGVVQVPSQKVSLLKSSVYIWNSTTSAQPQVRSSCFFYLLCCEVTSWFRLRSMLFVDHLMKQKKIWLISVEHIKSASSSIKELFAFYHWRHSNQYT